jgi:hypothetical protein
VSAKLVPTIADKWCRLVSATDPHGRQPRFSRPDHILNRYKNYFSQLLNVPRVRDVRQTEIHRAEPLVPDPSHFVIKIVVEKLKVINLQVVIKFQQN